MLVPGMYLADRYEILERIGSGGMADVYKAKCHKLNRLVAIKVLKADFSNDATFVRKFRVEAQSAAGLSHPNIVNVYDVGEENGVYFIVMELVQGITLKNYIEMKGKLEIKEALNISVQIASGLGAAHDNRIIHRDIKPQNIIMSRDGKVKITDFGIAKAADSTTVTTNAAGTVHYISPEQARGGYSDAKSDIYSLGITMYEMLTGRVPFDGETNVAVALLHIQGEMVPPRKIEPTIPRSFEKIVLKCTQKKPDRRYASAKELIADLRRVLTNPDGDYVVLAGMVSNETTVVMSDHELSEIQAGTTNNLGTRQRTVDPYGETTVMEPLDDDGDEEEDLPVRRGRPPYEEEDDDDEDGDEEVNPALEKVMKILGIVGGVILLIGVMVVLGRMAGFIGGEREKDNIDTTDSIESTESTEEPTTEEETDTDPIETEPEEVKVPSVINLTKTQAENELKAAGFEVSVKEETSNTVEPGVVISQNPDSGTMLKVGRSVTIVVSKGKESKSLIDVSGYTESQARSMLKDHDYDPYIADYEYHDTIPENSVIRTNPTAKSTVYSGDRIGLILSKGKEDTTTTMPSIIGQPYSSATSLLANAGLEVGNVEYRYDTSYDNNAVISATVASSGASASSGISLEQGSKINLVVNQIAKGTYNFTSNPFGAGGSGRVEYVFKMNGSVMDSSYVEITSGSVPSITVQGPKGNGTLDLTYKPDDPEESEWSTPGQSITLN